MSEDYSNIFWDVVRPTTAALARLYGTPSGAFTAGESVSGGTSGATAVVVTSGATYIDVNTIVGSFSLGETVSGATKTIVVEGISERRKQLTLVTTDSSDSYTSSLAGADANITVYYIAKDKLNSLSTEMQIPEQYQMAAFYYIMSALYAEIDIQKSMYMDKKYRLILADAIKDSFSSGVSGGQVLTSYEF